MKRTKGFRPTRRVKVPVDFDHALPRNWFGPIARVLLSRDQDWAVIDNVAKQTLRELEILTRSGPRDELLGSISRAVRALIKRGVLHEYSEGRVRMLDRARLERMRELQPAPRDQSQPSHAEGRGLAPVSMRLPGFDEIPPIPAWGRLDDEEGIEVEDSWDQGQPPMKAQDHLDTEEREVLGRLLGTPDEDDGWPAVLDTGAGAGSTHTEGDPVASALVALRRSAPDADARRVGSRLEGSIAGIAVVLDWRRDGSVRGRVAVPCAAAEAVLRSNLLSWHLAPIGRDEVGRWHIFRGWLADTPGETVVAEVLRDVQLVEDAIR